MLMRLLTFSTHILLYLFCTLIQELACTNESGLTGSPLKISWLEGQPETFVPTAPNNATAGAFTHSQV